MISNKDKLVIVISSHPLQHYQSMKIAFVKCSSLKKPMSLDSTRLNFSKTDRKWSFIATINSLARETRLLLLGLMAPSSGFFFLKRFGPSYMATMIGLLVDSNTRPLEISPGLLATSFLELMMTLSIVFTNSIKWDMWWAVVCLTSAMLPLLRHRVLFQVMPTLSYLQLP